MKQRKIEKMQLFNLIAQKNLKTVFCLFLCLILLAPAQTGWAQIIGTPDVGGGPTGGGSGCCSCPATVSQVSQKEWETGGIMSTVPRLINHVTSELTAQRIWMISIFWEDNILPAMMLMSEQLTATAMKQVQIIGSFMDARQQMETQQVLQKLRAQAHKDYQPSVGVCEFGSGVKSLASTERRGEYSAYVLSQRSQDRNLGQAFTAARTGEDSDTIARMKQFKAVYCDPADNNNGLGSLCATSNNGADRSRFNKDIDYIRTLAMPMTLNVDYTDGTATPDEQDLFALSSNLYGYQPFFRVNGEELGKAEPPDLSTMQKNYMDMRALLAKRSVAENSFNAIASLKTAGTNGSKEYLMSILQELGISEEEGGKMLGNNPSYYAQMDVLTKKIYQNPDFYTNLYDKPANVERKQVAMQAIGLMQKFDLFKSYLRQEASLSVLLELTLKDLQDATANVSDVSGSSGRKAPQ